MFCILMDPKTRSFYMKPGEIKFYAYTDPSECTEFFKNTNLVELDIDDYGEFMTYMYNQGFINGYLDGHPVRIKKSDVQYYKLNCNEIAYAQYMLTKEEHFLSIIKKSNLCTLCKVDNEDNLVYFPTVKLENGQIAVLAYTDVSRIPAEMREKYDGWRTVRMTFDTVCVVNSNFVAV